MSRSFKKPYMPNAGSGKGMSSWKTECNRIIRRIPIEDEIGNMSYFKRLIERYTAPDDGRHYWDNPKARRK